MTEHKTSLNFLLLFPSRSLIVSKKKRTPYQPSQQSKTGWGFRGCVYVAKPPAFYSRFIRTKTGEIFCNKFASCTSYQKLFFSNMFFKFYGYSSEKKKHKSILSLLACLFFFSNPTSLPVPADEKSF
jgi:hypothetical protein